MGYEQKRCLNCGTMDYFIGGSCSKCGFAPSTAEEDAMKKATAKESFMKKTAEKDNSSEIEKAFEALKSKEDDTQGVLNENKQSDLIDDPEIWMYVAAVLNPILMIGFVLIYILKNKSRKAFEIWIVTICVYAIWALIVYIWVKSR